MRLEDFIGRLDGVRRLRANSYAARCPAHDDRVGSLVVSLGDSGMNVVIRCHAGCDALDVVRAVGLDFRDLFCVDPVERPGGVLNIGNVRPAQPPRSAKEKEKLMAALEDNLERRSMPPEHIVDAWIKQLDSDFCARLRELKGWSPMALTECRVGWDMDRLTFPVYDPDMTRVISLVRYLPGGEPKSIAVGPRELWPAPESLPDGCDIWLVEGEGDRISAVTLGMLAVAVPGVAIWKAGWAERFRGHRVTVCMDCDEQGRTAAATRVRELAEENVEARMVDLWPAASDGEDLSDLLADASRDGRVAELARYLLGLERDAWTEAA